MSQPVFHKESVMSVKLVSYFKPEARVNVVVYKGRKRVRVFDKDLGQRMGEYFVQRFNKDAEKAGSDERAKMERATPAPEPTLKGGYVVVVQIAGAASKRRAEALARALKICDVTVDDETFVNGEKHRLAVEVSEYSR
jgi:hypothetical protein